MGHRFLETRKTSSHAANFRTSQLMPSIRDHTYLTLQPLFSTSEPTKGLAAQAEVTPTPLFPSTSAAFDLRPRSSHPPFSQAHCKPSPHTVLTDQNVSALHSYAFCELHQSITEASEGFVQRMRDWELSRPQLSRQGHRLSTPFPSYGRPRGCEFNTRTSSPLGATSEDDDLYSDTEDDVLILSDATSSVTRATSPYPASPPKKRARSLGDMDLDSPQMTPAIALELSSSTSSLLSLAPPPVMPPPSSREEKAIAALTLALANGAAGLNDYSAVREALGVSTTHADNASEAGEMWR
jgi:hypothetical protein